VSLRQDGDSWLWLRVFDVEWVGFLRGVLTVVAMFSFRVVNSSSLTCRTESYPGEAEVSMRWEGRKREARKGM
jgi:hypothetical protein